MTAAELVPFVIPVVGVPLADKPRIHEHEANRFVVAIKRGQLMKPGAVFKNGTIKTGIVYNGGATLKELF
jgi:hypothetical protein